MRITIESTLLADGTLLAPHSGLAVNGQQLVDDAQFFRAANATYFARGNAGVLLQFGVNRLFSSVRRAEAFALTHFDGLPKSGLVACECGEEGDTETAYLRDAVLESAAITGYRGCSVQVQYTIRGSRFESDVPEEEIPGEPDDAEGEFIVLRRGKVNIANGAKTVDVVFSAPLSVVPIVSPTVSRPAGGDAIWATVDEDSVTVNGFTASLSGAAPDGNYKLHYIAVE